MLMNYLMIIGTGELQGLTVKASRLVKLEITSCAKKKKKMTDDRLLFLVNFQLFRFYLLLSFIDNIVENVIKIPCIFGYY